MKGDRQMSVQFIHDGVLDAVSFVECYTGLYFTHCHTFDEAYSCLAHKGIHVGNGYNLKTELGRINDNSPCVLVRFSTNEDYTLYEYRVMRIQKRYLSRFKRNLDKLLKEWSNDGEIKGYVI